MEKDTRLINIYLNIHHKKTLTMDDLRYLAQYAPECFEKTCKNVVYNIPETKPIMNPGVAASADSGQPMEDSDTQQVSGVALELSNQNCGQNSNQKEALSLQEQDMSISRNIEQILENLKLLETNEFPVADVSASEVKNLLGNLYMEMLFPHNDKDTFFNTAGGGTSMWFDKKA